MILVMDIKGKGVKMPGDMRIYPANQSPSSHLIIFILHYNIAIGYFGKHLFYDFV